MPTGERGTPIAPLPASGAECRRNAVEVLPQSAISALARKITPRGVIFRNQLSINTVATASGAEPFARTEADKEQLMRSLKIALVITFFLAALTPAISTRVAALSATLAQSKSSKEKPDKNKDAAQSKRGQPVDPSQYVGGESCAECHAAEATHYALTAHNKTNVGNAPVDKRSCEACHGPAKGHVDFYLAIQKLNEAGKEDEATALMNDTAKAAAAKMISFKTMSSAEASATCLKCHADKQGPFVYEHAPVKIEGCQACHTPHGSTNPKLLTRNIVKFLCLECHSNTPGIPDTNGTGVGTGTPSFHDINNPRYANCTTCHFEIHGSNKDPFFR